ncbi:MAG: hypothetical protein PHF00_03205, partial [Elusimicrobia bacterium]|nr:hypothetical protein [Elusimicrobiota bacterium]
AIGFGGSLYIFRMLLLVFWGPRPDQRPQPGLREPGPVMAAPTVLLALGALAAGWAAAFLPRVLRAGWPAAAAAPELPGLSPRVSALGLAAAAAGAAAAYALAVRKPSWDWDWRRRRPGLEALCFADFGWRRLVSSLWSRLRRTGDRVGRVWDRDTWDAALERSASACRGLSDGAGRLATGSVSDALWWMLASAAALLAWGAR